MPTPRFLTRISRRGRRPWAGRWWLGAATASRFLAVAGWDDAAALARRARDATLNGDVERGADLIARLRCRVRRSWSIRWLLRGLAPLDGPAVREYGLSGDLAGDIYERLLALLDLAGRDVRGDVIQDGRPGSSVAVLPQLVTGLDLATARLAVASVDPDVTVVRTEAVHG